MGWQDRAERERLHVDSGTRALDLDDGRLIAWRAYARNRLSWEDPPVKPPDGWDPSDPAEEWEHLVT